MTLKDLEEWADSFDNWSAFAAYLGYDRRHLFRIRKGEVSIPARVELMWIKRNNK